MNPALYDMTVPVTRQMLGGLRQVLLKSEAHAKAVGYDPKIMRQVVRLRKMKPDDRNEMEMVLDTYKAALGLG